MSSPWATGSRAPTGVKAKCGPRRSRRACVRAAPRHHGWRRRSRSGRAASRPGPSGHWPLLVGPMRGEAVFVGAVCMSRVRNSLPCASSFFIDQRGVERTVAVGLGRRDVVLKSPSDMPGRVQRAERAVAVLLQLAQHAERHDVGVMCSKVTWRSAVSLQSMGCSRARRPGP